MTNVTILPRKPDAELTREHIFADPPREYVKVPNGKIIVEQEGTKYEYKYEDDDWYAFHHLTVSEAGRVTATYRLVSDDNDNDKGYTSEAMHRVWLRATKPMRDAERMVREARAELEFREKEIEMLLKRRKRSR